MKKLMFMAVIAMVLTVFNACQKDELIAKTELPGFVSSKYEPEYGKFTKEMIVYDSSGENSLFVAIHSNDEEYLSSFIIQFKLQLVNSPNWDNMTLKSGNLEQRKIAIDKTVIPKIVMERKVIIEFLSYNLKDKQNHFSLSLSNSQKNTDNKLKSGDFIIGHYIEFKTTERFLGVVHKGYGWDGNNYDIYTYWSKKDCWLCGWDSIWDGLLIGNDPYQYYGWYEDFSGDIWKLSVGVYFDARETDESFLLVTDTRSNFRGQECSAGSYDGANCFVGTPPPGTTAFISGGQFYYTPINGNQCPLPGSEFDGANCWVMTYPFHCDPFILNNSWYVKPDKILN